MIPSKGMTLVEVVVLFFICGLFVGVSVPAYTMWTDRKEDAHCKQNLMAIGFALNGYGADHEGAWPQLASERLSRSQQVPVLETVLLPYAASPAIFRCPGDDNEVYQRTGSSYRWDFYPEQLKQEGGIPDLSQAIFRIESRPILLHQAIVLDKEPFHKSSSHANGLYLSR
ncbi:MAG: type II secretion system protein [Verrucomicrobiota bacterium]